MINSILKKKQKENKQSQEFSVFEKKLGINFKDKNLLVQAFCHRSYLNEHHKFFVHHNERLEFLGDAVIELVVTEYIFMHFPSTEEGILTSWRAALVNSRMLSSKAEELNFGQYILLSRGEKKEASKKGKAYKEILANTFEAFIGALYIDAGYDICKKLLIKHLLCELKIIIKKNLFKDAKSRFQEISQEKERITPTYKVIAESGPDHDKHFVVGIYLNKDLVAKGEGYSKQEAEENAAQNALEQKNWH
ncbi:MAG: ribonuclease III [Candidatus Paceibacterota bacterium]|jgi:ribonuclease-3